MKLLIKYCGGCNPIINRKKLVDEVISQLKTHVDIEVVKEDADVGLVVGGCSVCCVNLDYIKDQARVLVMVGGPLVEFARVSPDQQANEIRKQIMGKGEGTC